MAAFFLVVRCPSCFPVVKAELLDNRIRRNLFYLLSIAYEAGGVGRIQKFVHVNLSLLVKGNGWLVILGSVFILRVTSVTLMAIITTARQLDIELEHVRSYRFSVIKR